MHIRTSGLRVVTFADGGSISVGFPDDRYPPPPPYGLRAAIRAAGTTQSPHPPPAALLV